MSTNLDELPMKEGGNINVNENPVQTQLHANTANNNPNNPNNPNNANSTISQNDINKIISSIQQATLDNLTKLPSRDIPMDQNAIQSDNQIKANYIPNTGNNVDYINNNNQMALDKIQKEKDLEKQNENLFESLQYPVLVFLIYIIFQLPFVNITLFKYIPGLFIKDNTLGFGGYIFKSVLFTGLIYLIQKNIHYLSL